MGNSTHLPFRRRNLTRVQFYTHKVRTRWRPHYTQASHYLSVADVPIAHVGTAPITTWAFPLPKCVCLGRVRP
jgi:hypothetical protein